MWRLFSKCERAPSVLSQVLFLFVSVDMCALSDSIQPITPICCRTAILLRV